MLEEAVRRLECFGIPLRMAIVLIAASVLLPGVLAARTWDAPEDAPTTSSDTGASLFTVTPHVIYWSAGKWTFLVSSTTRAAISSVRLQIDSATLTSMSHVTTTPLTSVWTFEYPPIRSGSTVSVVIQGPGGPETIAAVQVEDAPTGDDFLPGLVTVDLRPGILLWRPASGHLANIAKRPATQVPCTDAQVNRLLGGLGVTEISKLFGSAADGDSLAIADNGKRTFIVPAARSTYTLAFSRSYSPQAVVEMFRGLPAVVDVSLAGRVRP